MIHDMTHKAQHNDPFAMAYVLNYYGYKERQPDPVEKYIAEHGLKNLPEEEYWWPYVPNSQLTWTPKEKVLFYRRGLENYERMRGKE